MLTLLCMHAGLRVAEALSLTSAKVVGGGKALRLTSKGGKLRQVPLSQQLSTELSRLTAPDDRYLSRFNNDVTYRMKTVMVRHDLIWRGFHGLRKACTTRPYEATGDFTRVGLFLERASADITRRYVAVRADDLSRIVDGWDEHTACPHLTLADRA